MKTKCTLTGPLAYRLLAALLSWAGGAVAQWSSDPSENVQVANFGISPKVAPDGQGGAIIVWNTLYPPRVYAQRLDRYGYERWGNWIRLEGQWDEQAGPQIAADGQGGAVVAYGDARLVVIDSTIGLTKCLCRIQVQKLDSLGHKVWGLTVTDTNFTDQSSYRIISDGRGGAVVVWADARPSKPGVYVQRISREGQRLWGQEGVWLMTASGTTRTTTLVPDGQGGVIVAKGNKVQRVNAVGEPLWSPGGMVPLVVGGFSGGILGEDGRIYFKGSSGFTNSPYVRFRAHAMDLDGQFLWGREGVVLADSVHYDSFLGDLAPEVGGGATYTWAQYDPSSNPFSSLVQRVTLEGQVVFPTGGLSVSDFPSSRGPAFIARSDGDASIYAWADSRDAEAGSRDWSLYAQKISTSGEPLWPGGDVLISRRKHRGFQIVSDGAGGAIFVWYEDDPAFGIYAQQVSRNGRLGEVVLSVQQKAGEETQPDSFVLYQNFPNPFNAETKISYNLLSKSEVGLEVYDVLGKRITTLVNEIQEPGRHEIIWNGRAEKGEVSSGLYLYRLVAKEGVRTRKLLLLR